MRVLSLSKVKTNFSKVLDVVERRDTAVTITRNGKPVAVIVSKGKYDGLQETLDIIADDKFMNEIRAGVRALRRTRRRVTIDELFADEEKR
jgi:antitoxin YefM